MKNNAVPAAVGKGLLYVLLAALVISCLFPLYWLLITSLKTYTEALAWPPTFWPRHPTVDGYHNIIFLKGVGRYLLNSVIYAGLGVFFSVLFASMAGYAFSKFEFRLKNTLFVVVLATMMIPAQITLIPSFIICTQLKWVNQYAGLIIPGLASSFGVFLVRQYGYSVPNALFDSAKIDGAGNILLFTKIFIPLTKPVVGTLMVLEFMDRWNDLFWPLIITSENSMRTVQLAIISMSRNLYSIEWNQMTASMVLAMTPVLLLYFLLQKYFTQGIVMTGIKG